jgi:hypothetical protein
VAWNFNGSGVERVLDGSAQPNTMNLQFAKFTLLAFLSKESFSFRKPIAQRIQESKAFPQGFKSFLLHPVDTCGSNNLYELEIETTELRDLLSDLVSEILNYLD